MLIQDEPTPTLYELGPGIPLALANSQAWTLSKSGTTCYDSKKAGARFVWKLKGKPPPSPFSQVFPMKSVIKWWFLRRCHMPCHWCVVDCSPWPSSTFQLGQWRFAKSGTPSRLRSLGPGDPLTPVHILHMAECPVNHWTTTREITNNKPIFFVMLKIRRI